MEEIKLTAEYRKKVVTLVALIAAMFTRVEDERASLELALVVRATSGMKRREKEVEEVRMTRKAITPS